MSSSSTNQMKGDVIKQNQEKMYLGIDAGGTFTDFVLYKSNTWRVHKVLSTPDNPADAILQGIQDLNISDALNSGNLVIIHGSTVATNAALERKGVKTAYVTNKGFGDILTIGRQNRKELYNLSPAKDIPPVPTDLCFEVDCRRDAQGQLLSVLEQTEITKLVTKLKDAEVQSVAINLLFSFLNDAEEKKIEDALKDQFFVSRSSFVLPKYKEYERGMATWLNASLGPKVHHYMSRLIDQLGSCPLSVMQSSGGTISATQAADRAVNLLLSGPAGGLSAVKHIANECQLDKVISFDMGGTSTDVALMCGDFELTDEGKINDWPVAVPMLKMETIGAGGGSIAWLDKGGLLHVGPQSAGSKPGPICYGLGGYEPTVTDANLLLGRLQASEFLGGNMDLDYEAALKIISNHANEMNLTTFELASGIVELAEEHMVKALHSISVQKGHNPSEFTLCCFGGAGGMHVCALAEKLNMQSAVIPARSGVLSAFGMLTAEKQRQYTKTHVTLIDEISDEMLDEYFAELETQGMKELKKESGGNTDITIKRSLDLRYKGQSFTLNIPLDGNVATQFHHAHQQQYGHNMNTPVELVNVCVTLTVCTDKPETETLNRINQRQIKQVTMPFTGLTVPLIARDSLNEHDNIIGPAIISEHVSTTWLKEGWEATVDKFGHLHLHRTG